MLRAEQLGKIYHAPSGDVYALKDFSHTFDAGKLTAIMGPSGSGKSTLLNVLAGLDRPSQGRVWLKDDNLGELSENKRAEIRLKKFGFVFQSFNLISVLTAEQNVAFPSGLAGISTKVRRGNARKLLERFGLGKRFDHLPYKLSGGERQRVALARALINNPEVIFADEPTGNLDRKSGATVLHSLYEIAKEGRCVIVVTHDNEVANMADDIIKLEDGEHLT